MTPQQYIHLTGRYVGIYEHTLRRNTFTLARIVCNIYINARDSIGSRFERELRCCVSVFQNSGDNDEIERMCRTKLMPFLLSAPAHSFVSLLFCSHLFIRCSNMFKKMFFFSFNITNGVFNAYRLINEIIDHYSNWIFVVFEAVWGLTVSNLFISTNFWHVKRPSSTKIEIMFGYACCFFSFGFFFNFSFFGHSLRTTIWKYFIA